MNSKFFLITLLLSSASTHTQPATTSYYATEGIYSLSSLMQIIGGMYAIKGMRAFIKVERKPDIGLTAEQVLLLRLKQKENKRTILCGLSTLVLGHIITQSLNTYFRTKSMYNEATKP